MSNQATVRITEDGHETFRGRAEGGVETVAQLLETTAYTLRCEKEREHIQEQVPRAKQNGQIVAQAVNENIYRCQCGNIYGKQQSYASHKEFCTANDGQ